MPVCRNWQTRQTQNLLSARVCGFESHHRHQNSMARKPSNIKGLRAFFFAWRIGFFSMHISKIRLFDNGPPVLRQIWRSISVMDHRRIYPHDRVGRRHFGIEIQMSIDIRGRRNIAVTQPFLDFFQADPVCIQQTRAAMTKIVESYFRRPYFSKISGKCCVI